MSLGQNTKRIGLFGGNDFQVKIGSTWTNLGHLLEGTIMDETDSVEVPFQDGNSIELDGKRKVKVNVVLAQTSKEELELIDDLRGLEVPGYYNNGTLDSKVQEFYFPAVRVIPKSSISAPGQPKQIALEFSVQPQAALASVTPDTDMPSNAVASGSSPVPGKNKFYVVLETTPS